MTRPFTRAYRRVYVWAPSHPRQDDDAALQKKAYRALHTFCTLHTGETMSAVVDGGDAAVMQRLLDSAVVTAATAKRVRTGARTLNSSGTAHDAESFDGTRP